MPSIIYVIVGIMLICTGCESYTVTDYNNDTEKNSIDKYISPKKYVDGNNKVKDKNINSSYYYDCSKNSINNINSSYYNSNNNDEFNKHLEIVRGIEKLKQYQKYHNLQVNNTINNNKFPAFVPNNINPKTGKYYVYNANSSHVPVSKQGFYND